MVQLSFNLPLDLLICREFLLSPPSVAAVVLEKSPRRAEHLSGGWHAPPLLQSSWMCGACTFAAAAKRAEESPDAAGALKLIAVVVAQEAGGGERKRKDFNSDNRGYCMCMASSVLVSLL